MEAGAVAERAEHFNIPFYAIRVVTDAADENLPMDFNQVRDAEGRFDRLRILAAASRQPRCRPSESAPFSHSSARLAAPSAPF